MPLLLCIVVVAVVADRIVELIPKPDIALVALLAADPIDFQNFLEGASIFDP
jgi:hypothetical protein